MPDRIDPTPSRARVAAIFVDHPASVGESYWQHFRFALGFSGVLFWAACAALIHAVIPALHKTTASARIHALHTRLSARQPGA